MVHQIRYMLLLAWRSIRDRWVQSLATVLVVGMALALFVAVAVLGVGVRRGITEASDPFGTLVIGPKGDPQQLVLSTLLLNGNPLGTMDIEIFEQLEDDPRASLVIPLALADNFGGARVVGTTTEFFELQPNTIEASPFQLVAGRYFEDLDVHAADSHGAEDHGDEQDDAHAEDEHEEGVIEAVIGATAAAELNLTVGDTFQTNHGTGPGINQDTHDIVHEIVGVLQQTNTVFDGAIFVPVISVWDTHAAELIDNAPQQLNVIDTAAGVGELTAILVKPTGFGEANEIWQEFYVSNNAQAAFPGQELGKLLQTFRQLENILTNVGYLAAVMAGLTIFLAIYSATVGREQTIAVVRGVGAGRGMVLGMVLIEALIIALLGSFVARGLGYGAAWILASTFSAANTIPIPVDYVWELEWLLWLLPIGLGLLAGLIPALLTYRLNVVEKLFGT